MSDFGAVYEYALQLEASIPAGAALAGGSLPLSVIFALIACLLCASCIGLLSREMPAAGSLATYAARGLHPSLGFLVAWAYVLVVAGIWLTLSPWRLRDLLNSYRKELPWADESSTF